MPLVVPGLVEPKSKQDKEEKESKETKETKGSKSEDKQTQTESTEPTESQDTKQVDDQTVRGTQGMSEEAMRKFEEAMELEYQKREGGA
jgi:hypothetical protein